MGMCYTGLSKATGELATRWEQQPSLLLALPTHKESRHIRRVAMAYKVVLRLCNHCSQEFNARHPQQRFCSKTCAHYSRLTLAEHLGQRVKQCEHGASCDQCCWEWIGWHDGCGYGVFEYHKKTHKAHIVAYMVHTRIDVIQPKSCVCHRCDNPPCCNPHHLWLGSQRENMQDAARKGRLGKGPKGEQHPKTTLTTREVRRIRALRAQGWTYKAIHAEFPSVGRTTIQNIGNGKSRRYE